MTNRVRTWAVYYQTMVSNYHTGAGQLFSRDGQELRYVHLITHAQFDAVFELTLNVWT